MLGHEGMSPSDLLARGRLELEQYPTVTSRVHRVIDITPSENRFSVACADGFTAMARKVLLTTGLITMVSSTGTNLSRFMVRAIKVLVWLS